MLYRAELEHLERLIEFIDKTILGHLEILQLSLYFLSSVFLTAPLIVNMIFEEVMDIWFKYLLAHIGLKRRQLVVVVIAIHPLSLTQLGHFFIKFGHKLFLG